jgi:hypothetical protein
MAKKRRVYQPRIVGGKVMMPADLERLHKYMLEIEHIHHISDEMRAVVEELWPELAHKGRARGVSSHSFQTCQVIDSLPSILLTNVN